MESFGWAHAVAIFTVIVGGIFAAISGKKKQGEGDSKILDKFFEVHESNGKRMSQMENNSKDVMREIKEIKEGSKEGLKHLRDIKQGMGLPL